MKSAAVVFPASNCDRDAATALEQLNGNRTHMVWYRDDEIPDVDLVVIPGRFSYGDYRRCGAMASQSRVMRAVKAHAEKGGAVIDIEISENDNARACTSLKEMCEKLLANMVIEKYEIELKA